MLNIHNQTHGDIGLLCPEGRIDSTTADDFHTALFSALDTGHRVVVDFGKLQFISSAGLRVLLMAAKRVRKEKTELLLCQLDASHREVFEISGFLPLFTIHETVTDALKGAAE